MERIEKERARNRKYYHCQKEKAQYGALIPKSWYKCRGCDFEIPFFGAGVEKVQFCDNYNPDSCKKSMVRPGRPRKYRKTVAVKWDRKEHCSRNNKVCANYEKCLIQNLKTPNGHPWKKWKERGGKCYLPPKDALYLYPPS